MHINPRHALSCSVEPAASTSAEAVALESVAKWELRQAVADYWCGVSGRKEVDRRTLLTVASYVEQFGAKLVFRWIDKAAAVATPANDYAMGKFVSGCRRAHLREVAQENVFLWRP